MLRLLRKLDHYFWNNMHFKAANLPQQQQRSIYLMSVVGHHKLFQNRLFYHFLSTGGQQWDSNPFSLDVELSEETK